MKFLRFRWKSTFFPAPETAFAPALPLKSAVFGPREPLSPLCPHRVFVQTVRVFRTLSSPSHAGTGHLCSVGGPSRPRSRTTRMETGRDADTDGDNAGGCTERGRRVSAGGTAVGRRPAKPGPRIWTVVEDTAERDPSPGSAVTRGQAAIAPQALTKTGQKPRSLPILHLPPASSRFCTGEERTADAR